MSHISQSYTQNFEKFERNQNACQFLISKTDTHVMLIYRLYKIEVKINKLQFQ